MKKGLLIGFTKWQAECAYKIYSEYFAKHNIKLDLLKKDEYVLAIDNGKPLLCEVNANAGGIEINEQLTGINQAEKFVGYIIKKYTNNKVL